MPSSRTCSIWSSGRWWPASIQPCSGLKPMPGTTLAESVAAARLLLYHDLTMHEWMQATDVGKSPRLVELISKCLIGIEHLGAYPEGSQKDTVRNIILVGPGHLGSLGDD